MPLDQSSSPAVVIYILLILVLIASTAVVIWSTVYKRWRQGLEIIPFEQRALAPWRHIHVIAYAAITAGLLLAYWRWQGGKNDAPSLAELARYSLVQVVGVVLGVTFLWFVTGARSSDFGFPASTSQAHSDIRLGALASVALIIPILTIQASLALLDEYLTGKVNKSPILESIMNDQTLGNSIWLAWIAVIAAPIVEEMFFRVILQGWLEKVALGRLVDSQGVRPFWPILVSSLVFAALHANGGPDPLPIFILALALGYLYRQTHRLLPSLALHMCFNAYSVGLVLLEFLT